MDQLNNPNGRNQKMKVNAKILAAKFKSKREIWNFLATDCNAYLPHEHCVTIYFLKDLVSGKSRSKSSCN
jgi:hypothetical protein